MVCQGPVQRVVKQPDTSIANLTYWDPSREKDWKEHPLTWTFPKAHALGCLSDNRKCTSRTLKSGRLALHSIVQSECLYGPLRKEDAKEGSSVKFFIEVRAGQKTQARSTNIDPRWPEVKESSALESLKR